TTRSMALSGKKGVVWERSGRGATAAGALSGIGTSWCGPQRRLGPRRPARGGPAAGPASSTAGERARSPGSVTARQAHARRGAPPGQGRGGRRDGGDGDALGAEPRRKRRRRREPARTKR